MAETIFKDTVRKHCIVLCKKGNNLFEGYIVTFTLYSKNSELYISMGSTISQEALCWIVFRESCGQQKTKPHFLSSIVNALLCVSECSNPGHYSTGLLIY